MAPGVDWEIPAGTVLNVTRVAPPAGGDPMVYDDTSNPSGDSSFYGGGTIKGPYSGDYAACVAAFNSGERQQCFRFYNGENYRFDSLDISGFSDSCIRLDGQGAGTDPQKVIVNACRFSDSGRGVWCKHGPSDVIITKNYGERIIVTFIGLDDLSAGETYGPMPSRIVITGNIGRSLAKDFQTSGIVCQGSLYGTIADNVLVDIGDTGASVNSSGISVQSGGDPGTVGLQLTKGFTVVGNTVADVAGFGLFMTGVLSSNITGNTVVNWGDSAVALSTTFSVNGCENNVVSNNTLASEASANRAIWIVDANQTGNLITNNKVSETVTTPVQDDSGGLNVVSAETGSFINESVLRGYLGSKPQCFVLQIRNNAGVIEHRFLTGLHTTGSKFYDMINGATATYAPTPAVGVGTGFNNGGGVISNRFLLDTADHVLADSGIGLSSVERNTVGTALGSRVTLRSEDVNGITRARVEVHLFDSDTGSPVALDAMTLPSGSAIEIKALVYIRG